MQIIDPKFVFTGLTPVAKADKRYIVTHHPAARIYSPEQIHNQHKNQGWGGAGYHYYIRKDGSVYALRPVLTWGCHCNAKNKNKDGIGVCWEGHYDIETVMEKKQFEAGVALYRYLMKEYGIPLSNISRHLDWKPTSCPGKYFPWKALLSALSKEEAPERTPIGGESKLKPEQIFAHIDSVNKNCRLTVKLSRLIELYFSICKEYDIRAEVALAQAVHETNYFRYGNIVEYHQNNFAGLGALDGNAKGQAASFATASEGIRAHVQHLFAYARIEPIEHIVDPRFYFVKRGTAPYVEYLSAATNPTGQGWATDSRYGVKIKLILRKMEQTVVAKEHWGAPLIRQLMEQGVISEFHNPTEPVTWAELAAVVLGMQKAKGDTQSERSV
ncbi:MAG: N-acetylmuramoyl-L-alanine amidase [Peptostreptococcaceae bacterium]|nr:N-acetylmuramoyl-L-alanine amidase [Peptostreptococcaceae bacterium]